jgi:hypothetical protein
MFESSSEGNDLHEDHADCDLWKKGKVNYGSRRKKDFDDANDDGDDDECEKKYVQTAALTYRDTLGNTRSITANKMLN